MIMICRNKAASEFNGTKCVTVQFQSEDGRSNLNKSIPLDQQDTYQLQAKYRFTDELVSEGNIVTY